MNFLRRSNCLALLVLLNKAALAATPTSQPANIPPWSATVNGVMIRSEQAEIDFQNHWYRPHLYVRIRNVSQVPVAIPLPSDSGTSSYSISLNVAGNWEDVRPDADAPPAEPEVKCKLGPGEDVLCDVRPVNLLRLRLAEAVRVRLTVVKSDEAKNWTGDVQTEPLPAYVQTDAIAKSLRTLPMPTGESYGPDSARWEKWWQTDGCHDPRFQN